MENKKLDLLLKNAWTYKDIKEYFNVGTTKAINIKNRAIKEFDGVIPFSTQYVKCESVMILFGTTRESELKAIRG